LKSSQRDHPRTHSASTARQSTWKAKQLADRLIIPALTNLSDLQSDHPLGMDDIDHLSPALLQYDVSQTNSWFIWKHTCRFTTGFQLCIFSKLFCLFSK